MKDTFLHSMSLVVFLACLIFRTPPWNSKCLQLKTQATFAITLSKGSV